MESKMQYQRETGIKPDKDYLLFNLSFEDEEEQEDREKEFEKLYDYIIWLEEKLENH